MNANPPNERPTTQAASTPADAHAPGQLTHNLADAQSQLVDAHSQLADVHSLLVDVHSQLAETRTELAQTRAELAQVRTELAERKLIDQAKALLMQQHAISEPEAYAKLRKAAMDKGLKMAEVAQRLLDAAALLATTTPQTGAR